MPVDKKSGFLRDTYLFLKSALLGKKYVDPKLGASLEKEKKRRAKLKQAKQAAEDTGM